MPKQKSWGPSNPLYRWMQKQKDKTPHQKANKPKTTHRYVVRHMAKRRFRHRARSFLSFGTMTKFIKIGALVGPAAYAFLGSNKTLPEKASDALTYYTGFNLYTGQFQWEALAKGWMPYVATSLVITGVSKLNGIIKRL